MSDQPGTSTSNNLNNAEDSEIGELAGYAIIPLKTCPHLNEVEKVPEAGIDVKMPCATCGDTHENWVCLTCFAINCSRFVKAHALSHFEENNHAFAVSFSDFSAWCYKCGCYVHNDAFFAAKNAINQSKFGTSLPEPST